MRRSKLILLSIVVLPITYTYCDELSEKEFLRQDGLTICAAACRNDASTSVQPLNAQASSFFTSLLKTENWPPRWNCGEWSPFAGWFYIISDFLIWAAYFTIPGILFYFIKKQSLTKQFKGVFLFFIAFILLCGLTHLIDVIIFWWPAYRLSALIRFGTAFVSMGTVFALVKFVPKALQLKSPEVLEKLVAERTNELKELNKKYEQEIQERKSGEEEIKRLNKELFDFKTAITDSTIVSKTDKKGTINFVNDHFVEISGFQEDELVGQNHRIINSGHHGKEFWINMWKTIAKGKTWRAEVKNKKKNGDYYWVDTFIMPFKDEQGNIYEYLSIRNDITERKQVENELISLNNNLESRVEEKTRDIKKYNHRLTKINELFETVQSHALMGVWEHNVAKNATYLSKEIYKILDIKVDVDPKLSSFIQFVHKEYREKLIKAVRQSLAEGVKYDIEIKITTLLKDEKWVRIIGIPEKSNGQLISIKGLIQDVNKSKRIESELRDSKERLTQINEELSSFSYSVSHDLRAPIRYINGHALILEEDYSEALDEEGKEILQVIINNTNRMGQLIDDLLDFSRLGRANVRDEMCDMLSIVNSILDELLKHEEKKSVKLDIKKLLPVEADQSLMNQVWMNLISNALKYTKHKNVQEIEIGSEDKQKDVLYYIKDNGTGFDMAYSHKLFGVFQRLHRLEEFEGTGVGLAIVNKIITKHNGKVWAEAKVDQGATFYFTIPKKKSNGRKFK